MAQKFDPCKKKARTPGERPGGESRGIFHFKQGGRAGPLCFFLSMYSPRAHPGPPSPMDSKILIKPLSLWPEYSMGGQLDSVGTWHIECGRTDKRAQKIVAVTFCRWLLRFLLPAHTERGEQYDTLHSQEDGHFLTRWGSYNSLVVEAGRVELPSESTSTRTSPSADDHLHSLTQAWVVTLLSLVES